MPMPKGHKSKFGYATVKSFSGGADYRSIAEEMTRSGYKMNHATARNVFLSALTKIAQPIHQMRDDFTAHDVSSTVKDPRFQEGVAAILSEINQRVK